MTTLETVRKGVKVLEKRFESKLAVNSDLKRTLVSFQANKTEAEYRWFKYKEGFSASLIGHILDTLRLSSGRLLDPFAGSGVALFAARSRGLVLQPEFKALGSPSPMAAAGVLLMSSSPQRPGEDMHGVGRTRPDQTP